MNKKGEHHTKYNSSLEDGVTKKVLDLYLLQEIENSNSIIKLLNTQIEFCKLQKNHLLRNSYNCFQMKKNKKLKKELEEIDEKILKYYEEIRKQVTMIDEIQKTLDL